MAFVTVCHFWTICIVLAYRTIAVQYIIEVDGEPSHLLDSSLPGLEGCLREVDIHHRYQSSIFTGFAADLTSPSSQVPCLESRREVLGVWPSVSGHLSTSARETPESALYPPTSTPVDGEHAVPWLNSSTLHSTTGVDVLHEQGINGTGVTVAVIDTGLDYFHPGLGGGLGLGFTVSFGQNYAEGDASDPYDECADHATHLAGIIAGSDPRIGYVGTAPGANIEAYRVFGCDLDGENAARTYGRTIAAVLAAYERGVDVISMSLGFALGPSPDDPLSNIVSRIALSGRTVPVIANSNNGWQGTSSAGAPDGARGALIVGAAVGPQLQHVRPTARFEVDYGHRVSEAEFPWVPAAAQAQGSRFPDELPLCDFPADLAVPFDGCSVPVLADVDADWGSCMVLVRRGGCPFEVKLENIAGLGARYALVYNNIRDEPLFELDGLVPGILGAGVLSAETGEQLVSLLAAGFRIKMRMDSNFTFPPYVLAPEDAGLPVGTAAARSGWGPSTDLRVLPSVIAPGIGILSTLPRSHGGYGILSGSSMAAPYVSGCVALVRQAHPELSAQEVIRRVVTTAAPVRFSDGTEGGSYEALAPTWQQGSGYLNCLDAVRTQVTVDTTGLNLNDTEFFAGKHVFSVTNNSSRTLKYMLRHEPAASIVSLREDGNGIQPAMAEWTDTEVSPEFLSTLLPHTNARLKIDPIELRLGPGARTRVTVDFDVEGVFNTSLQSRCPLYSGFIRLEAADAGHDLVVPYGGVACRARDVPVLPSVPESNDLELVYVAAATAAQVDHASPYVPVTWERASSSAVFEVPGPPCPGLDGVDGQLEDNSTLFPTLVVQVATFSPRAHVHVVPADGHLQVEGADGAAEALFWDHYNSRSALADGLCRLHSRRLRWTGQLANGSWAAEGHYRFRVCASRIWEAYRDWADHASSPPTGWDCMTTSPFSLVYRRPERVDLEASIVCTR